MSIEATEFPLSVALAEPTNSNRIDLRFAELREANSAALVTYITAGDPEPTIEATATLIASLAASGADIIEVGVPYSDPQADGPSIQAASQRSLESGVNTHFVLDAVRAARQTTQVPIVLMTYYNVALRFGLERFATEIAAAGVDGVILTDLPPEEAVQWLRHADTHGLATIFLLAPTSTDKRIATVAAEMKMGFVYCVSRTGVTGVRRDVPEELAAMIARIRAHTNLPVCVGFGINTPEHVAAVSSVSDGAVIGSALVDFLHREHNSPDFNARLAALVQSWKAATLQVPAS